MAQLVSADDWPKTFCIKNLSSLGLGGVCDAGSLVVGPVTLAICGLGTITGKIIWVSGRRFGVKLDAAVDVAQAVVSGAKPDKLEPAG